MTGETENLVLELLRGMRAEIAAINKRFDAVEVRLDRIDARLDAIETQLEGIRYIVATSIGSLVTDLKDHDIRIAALEGTSA